ncbi:MAG: methyltransferase domain-containing protein [Clostridia bacterium]|nr:methyltransferase domain-containing protein [Clostridia bacterium]
MSILICPVCGRDLTRAERSFACDAGHSFDLSKEGYLNLLLPTQRRSRHPGDAPELCRARRAFLSAGHYAPLRSFVAARLSGEVVLDACCGEGYYTSAASERGFRTFGFDIAKDMVRLAARADKRTQYFAAGLHAIPVRTGSVDALMHLFAPPADAELSRVLRPGGTLIRVMPGERHLWELKQALYDTPYLNRETPQPCSLTPVRQERLRYDFELSGAEEILDLFRMTPYSYKTSRAGEEKLRALKRLRVTADFLVLTYCK